MKISWDDLKEYKFNLKEPVDGEDFYLPRQYCSDG